MSVSAALEGFGMSASLIVAIGAQNAYVLRQGIRRQRLLLVAGFCACMDFTLITAGVLGLGSLINGAPAALRALTGLGCLFLAWYGVRSLVSALGTQDTSVFAAPSGAGADPIGSVLGSLAAFTFLNPHVYLDTVVLLGSAGARHPDGERLSFVLGACLASASWFFSLAYGASFLAPLFRRPATWKVLDGVIAAVMVWMAVKLGLWALTGG